MRELNTTRPRWSLRTIAVILCVAGMSATGEPSGSRMTSVSLANLCVTEGKIEEAPNHGLLVNVPKMRAYVNEATPQIVEAGFTYLGETRDEARLGSGELRRQFGLKLRAADACNLVYAMWRIDPESKLVVSVKSNPGEHTSAECGNRGYQNIKARKSRPVPTLRIGDTHRLRAEMRAEELNVFVDNTLVWEGSVGTEGGRFEGPVGIRSDNAKLQLELRVGELPLTEPGSKAGCRPEGEVE